MNYQDILTAKFSHLTWTITDPNDYDSIVWEDRSVDKEHLDLLISDNNTAQQSIVSDTRKDSYPDIGDQLDMLWHAINADDTLKTQFADFYNAVKAVKDANPKSETTE
jgi:hypothetical protein